MELFLGSRLSMAAQKRSRRNPHYHYHCQFLQHCRGWLLPFRSDMVGLRSVSTLIVCLFVRSSRSSALRREIEDT